MEQTIDRKIHMACVFAALIVIALLAAAFVRDGNREWKPYQKTYRETMLQATDPQENPEFYAELMAMRPRVRQIMVSEFDAVDRCVSCHVGIDSSLFVEAAQPLRTHPKPALLEQHPIEMYGCTICHNGQGLATTHEGAGHKPLKHWRDSIYEATLIEARCGFCHKDYREVGAPKLADGEQLFKDLYCQGCHKMEGVGGTLGTELTYFADKGADMFDYTYVEGKTTKENWVFEHFRDPYRITPGTTMRRYGFSDYDLEALTTYLLSLTEQRFSAEYLPEVKVATIDRERGE